MMYKIKKFSYEHRNLCALPRMAARAAGMAGMRREHAEEYRRLRRFRDAHRGERCFIIATAPSLTLEDVEAVRDEVTFSVNSCFKLFDRTDWRPTYYGVTDKNVFRGLKADFDRSQLSTIFFADGVDLSPDENAFCFPLDEFPVDYEGTIYPRLLPGLFPPARFSSDIERRVGAGGTVVFSMLQIAAYMGFSEIALLGVDCDFTGPKRQAEGTGYRQAGGGAKSYMRQSAERIGERMLESFAVARKYADEHGFTIYNATRGGKLEAFERRTIEQIRKG